MSKERLAQRLAELYTIRTIRLHPESPTLYSAIQEELKEEQPEAIQVLGLTQVTDLTQVLTSADQVREEFRNNCACPFVLWVDDLVQVQLIQVAPNFESWGVTREFPLSPEDVADFLTEQVGYLFSQHFRLSPTEQLQFGTTVEAVQQDVQRLEPTSDVILEANSRLLLGFSKEIAGELEEAIANYQAALERAKNWDNSEFCPPRPPILGRIAEGDDVERSFCPPNPPILGRTAEGDDVECFCPPNPPILGRTAEGDDVERSPTQEFCPPNPPILGRTAFSFLEWRVKVLQQITVCYYRQACKIGEEDSNWQLTQDALNRTWAELEQGNSLQLIADSVTTLGDILCQFREWERLKQLAETALEVHQSNNQVAQIAQDYGFLAEVALGYADAKNAIKLTLSGIEAYPRQTDDTPEPVLSWLYYIQGKAQEKLEQFQAAVESFEQARAVSLPSDNYQLYLEILNHLQKLYFNQKKEYLEAFRIQQEIISTKQASGEFAFVGANRLRSNVGLLETQAPEIVASGRDRDVNELVIRLLRSDCKVIVLYGESRVGKSSLLDAGLMPSLQGKRVAERTILPVAMRNYANWVKELGKKLKQALNNLKVQLDNVEFTEPEKILEQLQYCESRQLQTVLIFDQFEEFFFTYTTTQEQHQFFELIGQCLENLHLKVVFALREDYLHYLLRVPGMERIGSNLLSREVLYELGNFSPTEAVEVVRQLTERSVFKLEEPLIEQLIKDLTIDGKVRPIELQVIGAQLQEENITTLEKYQAAGTKEKLVQRYLNSVVKACGSENEKVANLVLYLVTDEKNIRSLKSRAEIASKLQDFRVLAPQSNLANEQLDLVLTILAASGLVMHLPEQQRENDRYQFSHDYLVKFIREHQEPKIQELIRQLERERREKQRLTENLQQIQQKVRQLEMQSKELQLEMSIEENNRKELQLENIKLEQNNIKAARMLNFMILGGIGFIILAILLFIKASLDSEIKELAIDSKYNLDMGKYQKVLENGIQAGKLLKFAFWTNPEIKDQIRSTLMFALYSTAKCENISPYCFYETEDDPDNSVGAVSFHPDNPIIATAQIPDNKKISFWSIDSKSSKKSKIKVVNNIGSKETYDMSFSPNGQSIATVDADGYLKLWNLNDQNRTSEPIFRVKAHDGEAIGLAFSPDGQFIATVGQDGYLKLWNLNDQNRTSEPIFRVKAHDGEAIGLAFSPDGQFIATVGQDGYLKLWNTTGELINELKSKTLDLYYYSVSFSNDGKTIVVGDTEGRLEVWNLRGDLLKSFSAHTRVVYSISYLPKSSNEIVSASWDGTVKLWEFRGKSIKLIATLKVPFLDNKYYKVWDAQFSSDQKLLATRDQEKVTLWNLEPSIETLIQQSCKYLTSELDLESDALKVCQSRNSALNSE